MKVDELFGVGAWRSPPTLDKRRYGVPPGGPWDAEAAAYVRAMAGLGRQADVFELLQGTCVVEIEYDGSLAAVGVGLQLNHEGFCGIRPVSEGNRVSVAAQVAYLAFIQDRHETASLAWRLHESNQIRYLPNLFQSQINVRTTRAFSRAGVRFESDVPFPCNEQPSEPSCVGAIQSTPGGELIVIGPDGPTIGGYPRLGTVISADLDMIPRLKIGQELEFVPVTYETAIDLERTRRKILESRCAYLKAYATDGLG